MKLEVGQSLAGWMVELWYELKITYVERDGSLPVYTYYNDRDSANLAHKTLVDPEGGGRNRNSNISPVLVITKDGKTGYLLNRKDINLQDMEEVIRKAKDRAINKLSKEDQELLGLVSLKK